MALLGNISANHRNPQRHFGLLSAGTAFVQGNEGANCWRQHGMSKNFSLHDGDPTGSNKTGYPSGRKHPYSWSMPFKPGGMASILVAQGTATATGAMAAGKNAAATSSGLATVAGTAQLVVSGAGTSAGSATVSGNVNAALGGSGTSTASGTAAASIKALAWAYGSANGIGSASVAPRATGQLAGSIAPAVELEASSFSTYLLDQEDVESGLTLRKALRLIAAATAGKVSGASGNTVTIKNAVADSKDRIVATVDANGNRTAITYDLED